MSAGPEHDQPTRPDTTGLRTAWLGSRRVAVLAGVVAVGVLTGAGVAVAATNSPSPSPAPTPTTSPAAPASPGTPKVVPPGHWMPFHGKLPRAPFPFLPGFGGPGFLGGGLFGAVHGTAVVPKPGGGYQTVAFQTGKVTASSTASITLRSADGYSHSYQVNSATMVNARQNGIASIKAGDQVTVNATVSGSTATAVRIIDMTQLQQSFHRFFGAVPGPGFKAARPVG
jgi:hypothetical protein